MEGQRVEIDRAACVGCGQCVRVCVAHNIALREKKAEILRDKCILCAQCAAVCPRGAVTILGLEEGPVEKDGEVRLDPKAVLEVIRFRRSIRRFKPDAVPPEVVADILEAGRLTHTAKNTQDVSFVVLDRERGRVEAMAVDLFRKLRPAAGLVSPMARGREIDEHFFFFRAPLVIVVLAENGTNGLLAAQNMEFVAEAHGLGVLMSGFFTTAANTSRKIKQALGVPRGKRAAMTLVLGYPDVKFLRSAPRRKLDVTYL